MTDSLITLIGVSAVLFFIFTANSDTGRLSNNRNGRNADRR